MFLEDMAVYRVSATGPYLTIQAAVTAAANAKGNGVVVIPSGYTGTDTFTNASNVIVLDMRAGASNTGWWVPSIASATTLAAPGAIGGTTPASGKFTTLTFNAATATTALAAGSAVGMVAKTSQKSETQAADANVLTYAPPAVAGTYRVTYTASVSSATSGVVGFTLAYQDSNSNAQSATALSLFKFGTAAPANTFTVSAATDCGGSYVFDVDNSATNIVVAWVGGGTSVALVSAIIERLV